MDIFFQKCVHFSLGLIILFFSHFFLLHALMCGIIFGLKHFSYREQLNYRKQNAIAYKQTNMPVDKSQISSW